MYDEMDAMNETSTSPGEIDHESIDADYRRRSNTPLSAVENRPFPHRKELQSFLVACHQAAVSIDTMASQLGHDRYTIQRELILGLDSLKTARRRWMGTLSMVERRHIDGRN